MQRSIKSCSTANVSFSFFCRALVACVQRAVSSCSCGRCFYSDHYLTGQVIVHANLSAYRDFNESPPWQAAPDLLMISTQLPVSTCMLCLQDLASASGQAQSLDAEHIRKRLAGGTPQMSKQESELVVHANSFLCSLKVATIWSVCHLVGLAAADPSTTHLMDVATGHCLQTGVPDAIGGLTMQPQCNVPNASKVYPCSFYLYLLCCQGPNTWAQ